MFWKMVRTYLYQQHRVWEQRRLGEKWKGWPCPRGEQALLPVCPQVRGGGELLHPRLRHLDRRHPRGSLRPNTWTLSRTHAGTAGAASRHRLLQQDPAHSNFTFMLIYLILYPRTFAWMCRVLVISIPQGICISMLKYRHYVGYSRKNVFH